jgi:hypothetical protein
MCTAGQTTCRSRHDLSLETPTIRQQHLAGYRLALLPCSALAASGLPDSCTAVWSMTTSQPKPWHRSAAEEPPDTTAEQGYVSAAAAAARYGNPWPAYDTGLLCLSSWHSSPHPSRHCTFGTSACPEPPQQRLNPAIGCLWVCQMATPWTHQHSVGNAATTNPAWRHTFTHTQTPTPCAHPTTLVYTAQLCTAPAVHQAHTPCPGGVCCLTLANHDRKTTGLTRHLS